MIDKLKIHALKSIKDLTFDCKKLNILVGTNSSGKSTILQSLLIVGQNTSEYDKHGLNGPLVSLGNFAEVHSSFVAEDEKEVQIEITSDMSPMMYRFPDFSEDYGKCILPFNGNDFIKRMSYKDNLHYLSCSRMGANDVYNKNYSSDMRFGINGEFAFDFLLKVKNNPLILKDEIPIKYEEDQTLLGQVNYWLNYILGAEISIEDIVNSDLIKVSYDVHGHQRNRPKNVGSGVSYLISMIIMCLGSNHGATLIIENPEIHLHPAAQSRVTEFLYFIAESGRQLFIETHSDHIFNGIRAGIATKSMDKTSVAIDFVKFDEKQGTIVIPIDIGNDGDIENPQKDLFDQFNIDLNKMLGF